MLTRIETVETIWVGMTSDQKRHLLSVLLIVINNNEIPSGRKDLASTSVHVLEELRLALLNV